MFYAQIFARSNTFGTGLNIKPGIIDADYTDEIKLAVENTLTDHYLIIRKHSPLAQLRFADFFPRFNDEVWVNTTCADTHATRTGGFGSTTNKLAWTVYAMRCDYNMYGKQVYTYTKNLCFFDKLVEKKFTLPAPRPTPNEELSQKISNVLPQTEIEFVPFKTGGKLTTFPVPIKTASN